MQLQVGWRPGMWVYQNLQMWGAAGHPPRLFLPVADFIQEILATRQSLGPTRLAALGRVGVPGVEQPLFSPTIAFR